MTASSRPSTSLSQHQHINPIILFSARTNSSLSELSEHGPHILHACRGSPCMRFKPMYGLTGILSIKIERWVVDICEEQGANGRQRTVPRQLVLQFLQRHHVRSVTVQYAQNRGDMLSHPHSSRTT